MKKLGLSFLFLALVASFLFYKENEHLFFKSPKQKALDIELESSPELKAEFFSSFTQEDKAPIKNCYDYLTTESKKDVPEFAVKTCEILKFKLSIKDQNLRQEFFEKLVNENQENIELDVKNCYMPDGTITGKVSGWFTCNKNCRENIIATNFPNKEEYHQKRLQCSKECDDIMHQNNCVEKEEKIHNCYDYLNNKGDIDDSTYGLTMEGFYKDKCSTLKTKLSAKAAQKSFINNIKVADENFLKLLKPIDFSSGDSTYTQELQRKQDELGGIYNLMSQEEKNSIKINGKEKTISFNFDGESYVLTEKDRADYDNSGVESILIFQSEYAIGGSFRNYSTYILKMNENEKFINKIELPK